MCAFTKIDEFELKLAHKMEINLGEVVTGHLEDVVGVGKEDVAAFAVDCHVLLFAALEGIEGGGIVTFNPTCLIERDGFPATLGAILVEKTVLYHLELQLADRTDNLATIELIGK